MSLRTCFIYGGNNKGEKGGGVLTAKGIVWEYNVM